MNGEASKAGVYAIIHSGERVENHEVALDFDDGKVIKMWPSKFQPHSSYVPARTWLPSDSYPIHGVAEH